MFRAFKNRNIVKGASIKIDIGTEEIAISFSFSVVRTVQILFKNSIII
jgi:hypothetical protein